MTQTSSDSPLTVAKLRALAATQPHASYQRVMTNGAADEMEQRLAAATLTAPCGCTFRGRIYSTRGCTVLDQATVTGHQSMRHAMRVKKDAR